MNAVDFKVRVQCMTFNHAPYIEDAMNGFVMQETEFPYLCIIIDDASTDGEQDVICKYMQNNFSLDDGAVTQLDETDDYRRFFSRHKTNTNCFFLVLLLKYNHYSIRKVKSPYFIEDIKEIKYIALCEGDDYWTNPQKLQMQVEFMESHPDYVMCHTDFKLSDGSMRNHFVYKVHDDNYFPAILQQRIQIGTLTAIYRSKTAQNIPLLYKGKGWPMGDLPLWIELAHEGKIKFFDIPTACYRILPNSASHGSFDKEVKFANAAVAIRQFYANYYGIELPNNGFSKGYYVTIMKCAYKHHDKLNAKRCWVEAKKMHMISIKLMVLYCAILIPFCEELLDCILKR